MKSEHLKIVIATGIFSPEIGGPAAHLLTLVHELMKRKFSVVVVTYGTAITLKGVTIICIPRNWWRYIRYIMAVLRSARDADVIYAQDLVSSGLPTTIANLFLRKPLIIRIGGDFLWEKAVERGWTDVPLLDYYDESKNMQEKVYKIIYNVVLRAATHILFNSQLLLNEYQKRYKLLSSKCGLILNFIENDKVSTENVRGNEIVYAGRFITVKNLSNLIEAIKKIRTNKRFVFIGEGPLGVSLKKQANGRVTFVPMLEKDELNKRLQNSYLVVIPSLSEVCPNLVYESLLYGIPVIITAENGLPEDWKKYLKQFDPKSIEEIRNVIESMLEQNTYDTYKKQLQAIPIKKNVDEVVKRYLHIFDTLIQKVD